MPKQPVKGFFYFCLVIFSFSCSGPKKTSSAGSSSSLPQVQREFRAAWVATVANINWPSKPGLPVETQKQEAVALLDFLQKHNFNAAILQVRPQADALYRSDIEPWSYYLTGQQGKAPEPFYDPLEFWVKEAHDRGIELHVWLNPYRAHHKDGKEISDKSIIKKHPELVVYLKEGYWWMDPARKEVQDITNSVVVDLVKRYDIDGVHMDDYFYPYPSYNNNIDFPDSVSWKAYQQSGGKLSRGDWRRDAVNKLIERMYKNIKAEKPWVKFGLSPFGIWRPGYPESIQGFDQYDQLYADAKLWLNKGWIDYFTPQIYWPVNRYPQSFPVLLGWWAGENKMNRHLWPGISVGRDTSDRSIDETLNQIMIDRGMQPQSKGVVHWSISSVTKNPRLADTLLKSVYNKQALVPASPWLDKKAPQPPVVSTKSENDFLKIEWTHLDEQDVFCWVVYHKYNNRWTYNILTRNKRSISMKKVVGENAQKQILNSIIVTAVDRTGNESEKKEIVLTN
ncbi:MAG: family 10 glycosylhydrolase [Sphingobacteriales bacterium]|nr:family 10 glycosylhydrolase [Sphingobacteriales bacterium]